MFNTHINIYLLIIIGALLLEYFLHTLSRILDLRNLSTKLPSEFKNYYSQEQYTRSQKYISVNAQLSLFTSTLNLIVILIVIFLGLFNNLDLWIRDMGFSSIFSGLVFFCTLFILQDIYSTPFSIYHTFVVEEKFGFNKTSPKTYILDKIKSYILIIIIGGFILFLLLYFFEAYGDLAWLYAWVAIAAFLILIQPLFTLIISPIFNTFTPLENGELKQRIKDFAENNDFPLNRIDVMDGSRRSSKANAYFSGLGKNKRIALFDTLIENHTVDELLSIIAHEIGHYKKKHNIKGIIFGITQAGFMLYMLSIFINNQQLFSVFGMENISVYCSLLFFSILYSPIDLCISILGNKISRCHEYEADAFARNSIGAGEHLIDGLKKLTVNNLGNLTPHTLTVWLNYSHPTVLDRINKLR